MPIITLNQSATTYTTQTLAGGPFLTLVQTASVQISIEAIRTICKVHAELRKWLKDNVNAEVAASTRIIYRATSKKWQQLENERLKETTGLGSFAGYLLRMGVYLLEFY
ncbi:hypothetical protein CUMW_225030 [Citrus unshiu]|uniref:Uncharacterized protein n=1 Tax=Citrus unshiu TaxID=55188 RepID=A0A2H5QFH9_CITUN|nr:hypothetical protein CUMW_225030 [Citrus unshiu]